MLYLNEVFKNYEEFKELFGIVEHGNGVKSRKNKILLALYKDKATFKNMVRGLSAESDIELYYHYSTREDKARDRCHYESVDRSNRIWRHYDRTDRSAHVYYELMQPSLQKLKLKLHSILRNPSFRKDGCIHVLNLMENAFYSNDYYTDDLAGLCHNGNINAIRVRKVSENGKVYGNKAGKVFNNIMSCNTIVDTMPEQIKRWLSEEFVGEWKEYARENIGDVEYTLNVDDDFERIYTSSRTTGNFGSCMVDDEQWTFYRDAVKAKAAYLTDKDDSVVARCIVFTDVRDEDGKTWRLAERQYSHNSDPTLQRQLVFALIREGYIDGYKVVGASCGDARRFVDNDGNSLEDKRFRIDCELEDGDTLSYQDSFKWFDYENQVADNFGLGSVDLSTTSSSVDIDNHEDDCWSNYNEEYIDEDEAIYVDSRDDYFYGSQCVEALVDGYHEWCFEDDCIRIGGDYYYAGRNAQYPYDYGLELCTECDEYFVREDGYYSELTEEAYCCEDCMEEAERRYHEEHNEVQSDYDDEWYDEDDVITAKLWARGFNRYYPTVISIETFNSLVEEGKATEFMGEFYIDDVLFDGTPVHLHAAERFVA